MIAMCTVMIFKTNPCHYIWSRTIEACIICVQALWGPKLGWLGESGLGADADSKCSAKLQCSHASGVLRAL